MIRPLDSPPIPAPWQEMECLTGLGLLVPVAPGSDGHMSFSAARRASNGPGFEERTWRCGEGAGEYAAAWDEVIAWCGSGPLVVPDARAAAALFAACHGGATPPLELVGATELEALAGVGRRPSGPLQPVLAIGELRVRLASLLRHFAAQSAAARGVAARGWAEACSALAAPAPEAARALSLALTVLEWPAAWWDSPEPGIPPSAGLSGAGAPRDADADDPLGDARPPWARRRDGPEPAPLPPDLDEPLPFDDEDRQTLEKVFAEHLPALIAEARGATPSECVRQGQLDVSMEIATSLGAEELLLVHAPTGTGKTLAYLVPAMLWASRHGVRLGVATYTRALQEQAMDREVPLARAALARAGVGRAIDVQTLKGRANYACFRNLAQHAPTLVDPPWYRLAWTQLALFSLVDPEGDLDRFRAAPHLPGIDPARMRRELEPLVRRVRAESGCCSTQADRDTCGAHAARWRAERAHVVVTNHSLALARPELLRRLVFDECEHLHDQAHAAWSHAAPLPEVAALLERLGGAGTPLVRVAERAMPGTGSGDSAASARDGVERALDAVAALEEAAELFESWRADALANRSERDAHSLFREYVESAAGSELCACHIALARALDGLGADLAELAAHLDEVAVRGRSRLRRALDVSRGELEELRAGVNAWIPRADGGAPALRPETFHDLERDARGRATLAARVLLPHEYLGRHYYPELAGAVLISATTWLKGGFEAAAGYLGAERAANPHEEEEREPMTLRTFRAPEVFDYRRVLVATPRDAPPVTREKRRFLEYVARFVGHLGERTRGRLLVLFTNTDDCRAVGARLAPLFAARAVPFWFQGMEGLGKEDLSRRFREQVDSILMGLDTFWFGADFPGETLEHLVLVRLPYGVPDRYHHAQCAAIGSGEQWKRIYAPRALAKFRQGFGRLLRTAADRGVVYLLDGRVQEPRHRVFLRELPLAGLDDEDGARLVRGDTDHCMRAALEHMGLLDDPASKGLLTPFAQTRLPHEHG